MKRKPISLSEAAAIMGSQTSRKKAQAARENGPLGGRGMISVSKALARRKRAKKK